MDILQANIILDRAKKLNEKKNKRQETYRATNKNFKDTNIKYQKEYRDKKKILIELAKEVINKNEPIVELKVQPSNYKIPIEKYTIEKNVIINDAIPYYITNNIVKGVSIKNIPKYSKIISNIHMGILKSQIDVSIINKVLSGTYDKNEEDYIIKNMTYLQEKDINTFIEYLETTYKNNNTRRSYISPFVVLSSYIEPLKQSYQILSKYMKQLINIYEDGRDENNVSYDESKRLLEFAPEEINKKIDSLSSINNKMLFAIYTLITPRRLEWANVKITNKDDGINNILILDNDNKENTTIIFNKYKTHKSFGKQILKNLPDKFLKILYEYLNTNYKKEEDFLFTNKNNKRITDNVFGCNLSLLFSNVYKSNITLRFIRMSYATYHSSFKLSNKDIKIIATAMGHSIRTHTQYVKKFIV
jgi:integrase